MFAGKPMNLPPSYVQRFLLENLDIRGTVVKLTDVWQAMQRGRNYPSAVAGLLGEMSAIAVAIVSNLKQPGRITFHVQGNGPVNLLAVDCRETLNLRGYARVGSKVAAENGGLAALLGNGHLQLSLDMPELEQPYQSIVPLKGGDIAGVFTRYLEYSEQQAAGLWLACDEATSAALFIQKLPGADAKDPDGWTRVLSLAETARKAELLELDPTALLRRLFSEEDVRLYSPCAVTHNWPPEPEKIVAMLRTMGEEEVRNLLAEYGEISIQDEMSNHDYCFGAEEIDAIFRPSAPR